MCTGVYELEPGVYFLVDAVSFTLFHFLSVTRTDTLSCFTGAPSISFCLTMFSISGCTLSICDMCAVVKISLQALQPGSEDFDTRNLRWMNACDDFELFETAAIALFSELQLSSKTHRLVSSPCIACGSTALIRLANPQHCHHWPFLWLLLWLFLWLCLWLVC